MMGMARIPRWLRRVAVRCRTYAEKDGRGYPDWACRYLPVVRRWRRFCFPGMRVIEIGANANGFSRLAHTQSIAVDITPEHLAEARAGAAVCPVAARADDLPFADDCGDFVVCMDTLEHIPPGERLRALEEMVRVLHPSGHAVIGFPAGIRATRAEARIRKAYRRFTGGELRWLEEHGAADLPETAIIVQHLARAARLTHRVRLRGNTNILVWTWMWRVLMCGWPGRGNAFFQAALRVLTPLFSRLHVPPCYRVLVWLEPQPRRTAPGHRDV